MDETPTVLLFSCSRLVPISSPVGLSSRAAKPRAARLPYCFTMLMSVSLFSPAIASVAATRTIAANTTASLFICILILLRVDGDVIDLALRPAPSIGASSRVSSADSS